jgi:2-polyprenyl-3-methyl-5-hydroxy-6-metoxy-1,4-benzoquinol methylase
MERTNPLSQRLFESALGMFDLLTVYLGDRLGLYRALADDGPSTPGELSSRTGTYERYVREWLEQQAVTGILEVENPDAGAEDRRYALPLAHIEALVDQESLNWEAYKAVEMVRGARSLPELVEAFRTGEATAPVPWEPEGRPEFNRARFLNLLGKAWLPAIRPVHMRLTADPPARVADLGCGTGWAAIAMARAYPKILVDGFDFDEDAIAAARTNAQKEGLGERLRFFARDVAAGRSDGRYDLVTLFEAIHDMSFPVRVLRAAREALAENGSVVIGDERVGDRFSVEADDFERYMYGWSVLNCLPEAMVGPEAAGTGAVMRPDTLRGYALEAGFRDMEILPIETNFWRFYRLIP